MRTTISIDDELLALAKQRARERDETLGSFVEEALRRELAAAPPARQQVSFPVFQGDTGPRPGVDLTSSASVQEAMDDGIALEKLR
jgi:hypothetical protein